MKLKNKSIPYNPKKYVAYQTYLYKNLFYYFSGAMTLQAPLITKYECIFAIKEEIFNQMKNKTKDFYK